MELYTRFATLRVNKRMNPTTRMVQGKLSLSQYAAAFVVLIKEHEPYMIDQNRRFLRNIKQHTDFRNQLVDDNRKKSATDGRSTGHYTKGKPSPTFEPVGYDRHCWPKHDP